MWEYIQFFCQFVIKMVIEIMGDKFAMLLMVEMLENFAKMTENTVDDEIVKIIKQKLVLKEE